MVPKQRVPLGKGSKSGHGETRVRGCTSPLFNSHYRTWQSEAEETNVLTSYGRMVEGGKSADAQAFHGDGGQRRSGLFEDNLGNRQPESRAGEKEHEIDRAAAEQALAMERVEELVEQIG